MTGKARRFIPPPPRLTGYVLKPYVGQANRQSFTGGPTGMFALAASCARYCSTSRRVHRGNSTPASSAQ